MKITNRFKSKIYITVIRIGEIVLVFIDLLLFILIVFSYFIYVLLINLRLKGIVHFEIKIWYLSAYPKGIQDVGVFFSSVDPILMFLGQTQGWTGNRAYRAFSRWADALKGPTEFFFCFVFFAKDHHAGTTSSQWPIGLSPALTA